MKKSRQKKGGQKKKVSKESKWSKKIEAYALRNAIAHKGKALENSVVPSLFHDGLKKSEIKKVMPEIKKIVKKVNKMTLGKQVKEFEKLEKAVSKRKIREGLPELPNASKGVVMRISPSPSGPLHIGHALVGCLNYIYVQKYGGKFYVRIEDTNPETIYAPAYKMIKNESRWLFNNKIKFIIQSERMNLYYKYAEKLIKKGKAYVCECPSDRFREFVMNKKECECTKFGVKEQIDRWKRMLNKKGYKAGEAVLRFKSAMKHKNPAFRNFPLARISEIKHPLQKKKYKVWPLMNLAVSVDDIEMKITHIIRAKEHRDNAERQKMIYKVLGKKYPWSAFIGRIHFKDFQLSTRKIREGIKSGRYKSWDDPSLPTIAALKKKYKPEVFLKFSEMVGLSDVDKVMDKKEYFRFLDNFNRS